MGVVLRTLASVVLLSAAGCVALPPSEEARAAFGPVAVVPGGPPEDVDFAPPVAGWAAGLGYGTLRSTGCLVLLPLAGAEGNLPGVVLGAAFAVVWFPVSMVGGAVTAESVAEVEAAEAVLRPVVEDPGLPGRLASVVEGFVLGLGDRQVVAPGSATTLLEARILRIERGSAWNLWSLDRPFGVEVEVGVRVVRRSDGEVLWRGRETSPRPVPRPGPEENAERDGARTWSEWAADGGVGLRARIDALLVEGAERLVYRIFREPSPDPVSPAPGEIDPASARAHAAPASGARSR